MLAVLTPGRFIHWNKMRYCVFWQERSLQGLRSWSPSVQRQTLGNNGPGDWWARWVCPLNRPINLDEVLAAPSQIFPSAYFSFMICLSPLFLPPTFLRWKSLVIIVVAGSSLCILTNGEIFILWDMGRIRRSLLACGEGWRFLTPLREAKVSYTRANAHT